MAAFQRQTQLIIAILWRPHTGQITSRWEAVTAVVLQHFGNYRAGQLGINRSVDHLRNSVKPPRLARMHIELVVQHVLLSFILGMK